MRLIMQERKTVTKAMANQYRRSSKKGKGMILSQFVESTGYNRVYVAQLLRGHGKRIRVASFSLGANVFAHCINNLLLVRFSQPLLHEVL